MIHEGRVELLNFATAKIALSANSVTLHFELREIELANDCCLKLRLAYRREGRDISTFNGDGCGAEVGHQIALSNLHVIVVELNCALQELIAGHLCSDESPTRRQPLES